jgi:hypothetical protein
MKKIIVLSIVVSVAILTGCAGMPIQEQYNRSTNAALYGLGGAAVGAAVAGVTKGNVLKGALIGGLAGMAGGALNTPTPYQQYASPYGYVPSGPPVCYHRTLRTVGYDYYGRPIDRYVPVPCPCYW